MKLGVIGRSEQRGLGIQLTEFVKNMPVDRVLHVTIPKSKWPADLKAFGSVPVTNVTFDGCLPELETRAWLHGLDVVFTAETVYDWSFIGWAKKANVKVVVQGNPEFYRNVRENLPEPDEWWWPTPWRSANIPEGPVVPVPVPTLTPVVAGAPDSDVLEIVHVAGHRAAGDRNGTELFLAALKFVTNKINVRLYGQDGHFDKFKKQPHGLINVFEHGVEDRWQMFDGAHLVVLPRRYGGLCLPAQEAMCAGCAVMMPDCSPNKFWPVVTMPCQPGQSQMTPAGPIRTYYTKPRDIAAAIDQLCVNRFNLMKAQTASFMWAKENSWTQLRQTYINHFQRVLETK